MMSLGSDHLLKGRNFTKPTKQFVDNCFKNSTLNERTAGLLERQWLKNGYFGIDIEHLSMYGEE
jgi:hypothetical protein